ncbi:MAG: fumarylacetoacetate hydrolase family protein [Bacteroidales bacterium]|jgi:2-keto-4-pentenoate hydratase/2-oxohepta-3-ene-1,7-dioic acid hydratase in catechol pathway|nr:fumarylacetoacetate hydrolase family protein [Bacteroidales bacterium]
MKIICIGLNYSDHIKECNHSVPEKPLFFLKPETALLVKNRPFFLPDFSQDVQYELEMVVRINKVGKCIHSRFAHTYYNEIGLGIDFTARDLQKQCIEKGEPWETAKGFDYSAVVSSFVPVSDFVSVQSLNFHLLLDGKKVQQGNTSNMLFSVDEIISHVSRFMTLKTGDLIFTGTPSGVGKVNINNHLEAYLEDKKLLDFYVR